MGAPFSDITLYLPTPYPVGSPEYIEHISVANYVSDLYVQKLYGYKPPKTSRITIQPGFNGIWKRASKLGSIISIAGYYNHSEYLAFDKKGRYRYILEIIQTCMLELTEEYNWGSSVFEKAYNEIITTDFEFRIIYPPKMSRDKKKLGQVIIEKNEKTTSLYLQFTINNETKKVMLFENRNWFWYDIAYELAKNSKWLDSNTFGVYSKITDKFGYYSLVDDVIIGKLDFKEDEFIMK